MTLKVWNGSAWTGANGVKVWNGSSWVSAAAAKVWNGSSWVDFLTTITLQPQSITANFPGYAQASAVYELGSDGYVYQGVYSGTQYFTQIGQWCNPASDAVNYEAYATPDVGVLSSGTLNAWVPLSSNQYWRVTVSGPSGDNQVDFNIAIRRVGTTTILANTNISLYATTAIS